MKKEKNNNIINWIALILFVIIMTVLVIDVMRKHIIIEKIVEGQKNVINQNNYSYTVESYNKNEESENSKTKTSFYKKDKISMYIVKNKDNSLLFWYNQGTNEQIILTPKTLKASVNKNSSKGFENQIPYLIDKESKNIMKIFSIITSDNVNGEECHKINTSGLITWYSKKSGMILKAQNGKAVVDEKEYDCISEFKDWKFDELTDIDVTRPNLMGYEVTNNE